MANHVLVDVEENYPEPAWLNRAEAFVTKVMEKCGWDGEEVSVLFCSDAFIQQLNNDYRNIDSPTDVLSFENGESYEDEDGTEWTSVGDIAISLDTLPKNALYFEVDADEELKRLLVHGLLHLHGMDHGEEHVEAGKEPECEMLKLQKEILEALSAEHIM